MGIIEKEGKTIKTKIIVPNGVVSLEHTTFSMLKNIVDISLPDSIEFIDTKFFSTYDTIKQIHLNNYMNLFNESIIKIIRKYHYCYFNKLNGEILISKEKETNNNYIEIPYKTYMKNYKMDKSSAIFTYILLNNQETKNFSNIIKILPLIIKNDVNKENYKKIIFNLQNNKEFNNLIKRINKKTSLKKESIYNLYKLVYILGGFNNNQIERQKSCEFLYTYFDKNIISQEFINKSLKSVKFKEFDGDLAKFIMDKNNFIEIIKKENREIGYIAKICDYYKEIKEYSRSNKGSQKTHLVTIDLCDKFFNRIRFKNVTAKNIDISSTIIKYTNNQNSFDYANAIREEYLKLKKENKVQDHLLDEELKEDIIINIEELKKQTLNNIDQILKTLSEISNKTFTYEFLSKYDPDNFILGKYCSCCSHLEGLGKGIMKASILHPDCQNLVIRSKAGYIIAKSTLYINREQRYGVFNNVEINDYYAEDEKIKNEIYLKYIEAINKFAEKYNEKYPDKQLIQINVGMKMNDLSIQIRNNHQKANTILNGLKFNENDSGYIGGWQKEQYIIWKKTATLL